MLQQPDIDELLRARLQGAEVAPPAFVWPNVERALRRRKRRFLLWIFGAGMAGACVLAFWFWNEQGFRHAFDGAQSAQTQGLESGKPLPPAAPTASTSEYDRAPVVPSSQEIPASTGLEKPAKAGSLTPRSASRLAQTTLAVGALQPGRPSGEPVQAAASANTVATPAILPAGLPAAEQSADLPTELSLLSGRAAQPLAFFPKTNFSKLKLLAPPAKKRRIRKNCYDFEKHSSVWMIDAYAGPSQARKTLRADADNQPYLNRRLETEHPDWAFNAGLRASWLFDKHFLLRTGVHYEQFTEVFEYVDPNFVQTIVQYTTVIVNGQPVTQADTLQSTFGANYIKTYNRFGLLDIPLLAGVEWRQGNGGIAFTAGGSLNVSFWKRGDIIAPGADVPVTFTPGRQGLDVFRPRVGLSLTASAQFFYHLQPRLRVFAEPYYRHILQPVNQSGHPVEQRYGIGGIRIGLTRIID